MTLKSAQLSYLTHNLWPRLLSASSPSIFRAFHSSGSPSHHSSVFMVPRASGEPKQHSCGLAKQWVIYSTARHYMVMVASMEEPLFSDVSATSTRTRKRRRLAAIATSVSIIMFIGVVFVGFVLVPSGLKSLDSEAPLEESNTIKPDGESVGVPSFSSFVTMGPACQASTEKYWSEQGYDITARNLYKPLKEIEEKAAQQLSEIAGAGLVLHVVYGDRTIWSRNYGYAHKEEPDKKPNQDTVFMLGSLSKIFPVLQLFMLRNEGVLSLDDEVQKLFPEFTYINPFPTNKRTRGLTWRMLASELSGLPREAPNPCSIVCDMTTEEVLKLIGQTPLVVPPNTVPSYSNVAYSLIGRLLERVTGMTFEKYMEEKVFKPLGMDSSGFEISPEIQERLATGYADGKPVDNKDVLWNRPTGAMYSTARDLSKFMSFLVTLDKEGVLMDTDSVREFGMPVHVNGDGQAGFGMPWEMVRLHDELVRFKGGYVASNRFQIGGFRTGLAYVPDLKLAVVAVANSGGGDATTFTSLALKKLIPAVRNLQKQQYDKLFMVPRKTFKKISGDYVDVKTGTRTFHIEWNGNTGKGRYRQLDFHANYDLEVLEHNNHKASFRLHPVNDGLTCLNMQVLAMQGPHLEITFKQGKHDGVKVMGILPDIAPGQHYELQ